MLGGAKWRFPFKINLRYQCSSEIWTGSIQLSEPTESKAQKIFLQSERG